jgi:hypothetical protein
MTPPVGLIYQKGKICLTIRMMEVTRMFAVRRGMRMTRGIVIVPDAAREGINEPKTNI